MEWELSETVNFRTIIIYQPVTPPPNKKTNKQTKQTKEQNKTKQKQNKNKKI